jgi:hypothetical protein
MKAILGLLMVFGVNAANAEAVLCDNEVVIQAVQKVMESIDAESKAIAGMSVIAEQPVRALAGIADGAGMSVDTFTVGVNVTNGSETVAYKVQLSVDFNNADGTCDYIKKTTQITIL